ncbi:hypothetical protein FRACYDRAFT_246676 [Fragilariopsis cylindrus CCMP1102]|uniref:Uncharacterized protein n=1 Tax=Fragilariopsis cylindrus CCMP1102 TaxID=635003 RepID=A0A1E7EXP4_9STRA|nr:hypothetical protein FRACYDRAFT_246676 [Fragilariopsis cylindrus CCMP1102]|eukprot:OEU10808.1 hypothetical protein FRACYDRAFT_246676 [Fragilariopsis cylindrus CCMP1102]
MNLNYNRLTSDEIRQHFNTARNNNLPQEENLNITDHQLPVLPDPGDLGSTDIWNDDLRELYDEEMVEIRNLREQNVCAILLDGTLIYNEDQPEMDIEVAGDVEEDTPMDIESEVVGVVDGYDVGEVVGDVNVIDADDTTINVDGDDVVEVDAINVDDVIDGDVVGDVDGEVEVEAERILDDNNEFILDEDDAFIDNFIDNDIEEEEVATNNQDDAFIDNDNEEEEVATNNQDEMVPPTQIELTTRPKCRHLDVQRTILERLHKNELIDYSSMNENEQKLANVGFSQENIDTVKLLQERKKSSCAEPELFIEYLKWSLQVIIRASTDNIEEAYENAVEHRRKLCELVSAVDKKHGSNYRSRLNLGSFPSKYFQVLCIGNYAPKECMKYVDVLNEINPLTRANKIDFINPCIRMIYNIIPASMMNELNVQQTSENFEEDRNAVLQKMYKRICFIDRSVICSENKNEYLQEISTFCSVMGIPFNYYHLMPTLCIAFQAILSNASQKKAITVMAMGASAIKYIRGTIPVRTSTSCVCDGGGILHTENAWNRKHLGSRYCYPTQLLHCYDQNLQFFYTNIEEFNLFIDYYDDYITTILRRWGGAVGSPQTAAELNDLKAHMTWLYNSAGLRALSTKII